MSELLSAVFALSLTLTLLRFISLRVMHVQVRILACGSVGQGLRGTGTLLVVRDVDWCEPCCKKPGFGLQHVHCMPSTSSC